MEKDTVVCLFVFEFERTSVNSGETACFSVFTQGFGKATAVFELEKDTVVCV